MGVSTINVRIGARLGSRLGNKLLSFILVSDL